MLSLLGLGVVLAPALGPGIAGWLVDHIGWQYVLTPGVVPALLGALLFHRISDIAEMNTVSVTRSLDLYGLSLLSFFVVGLVILPILWQIDQRVGVFTVTLLVLLSWCFFLQQRRTESILPLSLLSQIDFRRLAIITASYGTGMYGSLYLIPLWLQDELGVSASTSGSLLLVGGAALALSISVAGSLVDRFTAKPVLRVGILCFAFSCGLFCLIEELPLIALAIVLGRVGLGSIIPSLYPLISNTVDIADLRQATAFTTLLRQAGGMIGVMMIGLAMSTHNLSLLTSAYDMTIYTLMFFIFSLIFIVAILVLHRLGMR